MSEAPCAAGSSHVRGKAQGAEPRRWNSGAAPCAVDGMAFHPHLGRIGIWTASLRFSDPERRAEIADAAAQLDTFGFGAIWLGGNASPDEAGDLLAATSRTTIGTSILSIWDHTAAEVAARHTELNDAHPGRLVLGLGVSHDERYGALDHPLARRPYTAMRAYLDALDAAERPVPPQQRALAALGPKMLRLARDRALGALPYLVTPEHTAEARAELGPEPLLAPELKVVLIPEGVDPEPYRETARAYLSRYLELANYRNNWLRLGFTEEDFPGGGSDRLIDAVYAIGSPADVRRRVDEFFDAGADHVALQAVTDNTVTGLPLAEWRLLGETFADLD